MNLKYKQEMDFRLKKAENMAEMFKILGEYYDLEACKPGPIVRGTLINGLQAGVRMVNAKPKKIFQ